MKILSIDKLYMYSFLSDSYPNNQPWKLPLSFPNLADLPKSSMGYAANNQYREFPPMMDDGRAIVASWQQNAAVNEAIIKENNIRSNWEYRRFITQNATRLMREAAREAANDIGYYERAEKNMVSDFKPIVENMKAGVPFTYQTYFSNEKPFGYQTSDLKEEYLSREQLQARMIAPSLTQDELLQLRSGEPIPIQK